MRRFSAPSLAHSASWPGSINVLCGEEGTGANGTPAGTEDGSDGTLTLGDRGHHREPSKSRLIRDLALRGAEVAAQERQRGAEAIETLVKIADGEIGWTGDPPGDRPLGLASPEPGERTAALESNGQGRTRRCGRFRRPRSQRRCAWRFGVLHADKHFEALAEVHGFESVRVG